MHDKDDDHVKSDMPTQSSSAKKKQTNRSSMAIKSIDSINTEQLAQSPRDNSDKTHATTLSEHENDSEASFEIAPEISRSVDYFDT
ncbi:hypothetical protein DKX15_19230, partial [Enterococcus faecium]